ncbi:TetR/AcrR family transcriptional regulator [Sphaerisporangium sp. TRM90804]|uniref:TetR/AcrR family transcriptional regulator n=1 Tax=Sphaerisporangium sp. TRM90804 TaxID=3031113 RepID=UPI0024487982|nr:TetR/AcrR family transcriptional regulator [Sphaerisporangium sp. TRM90804]MDH2427519.1 TetR/AcrR family transcriptional regulator [Sphaerisporangium sp. TRM90804]
MRVNQPPPRKTEPEGTGTDDACPPRAAGGRKDTPAGAARRAQIVRAAIETIAELGYNQASFARIAAHAGLSSTRLISYHFAGKEELIRQILTEVYTDMGGFMTERVGAERTASGALRAYIRSLVGYIATHRAQMTALMEIFLNFQGEGATRSHDAAADLDTLEHVEKILRWGQHEGEFRAFDTRVMAMTVQRAIENLPFLLQADPGRDVDACADEMVTLFDLATRAAR